MSDRYEDRPGWRWSHIKLMAESALAVRYAADGGGESSGNMDLGTAVHTLVFEPDKWGTDVIVYRETKQRKGKAWDAFAEKHAHATIITPGQERQARAMADAVRLDPVAAAYIAAGGEEKVCEWTDAETGLPLKCKADFVGARLVELKSTGDMNPYRFWKTAANLGYDGQLAHYLAGLRAQDEEPPELPAVIAVGQNPPHDVVVYDVPPVILRAGEAKRRRYLRALVDALEQDEWPGIAGGRALDAADYFPAWAYPEDMDDLGWAAE